MINRSEATRGEPDSVSVLNSASKVVSLDYFTA